MTMRSWIRRLFTRPVTHTVRRAARRARPALPLPALEMLEDRWLPSTFVVTDASDSAADTGSLRYAINNLATGSSASTNTINFSLPADSVITLSNGALTIAQGVTINGPGASSLSISGNNASQVFNIESGTVTISGLSIIDGYSQYGGAIYTQATQTTISNCYFADNTTPASGIGGAIYNKFHTLTLQDDTFYDNTAVWSGAVDNYAGGTINISNSTFDDNSSQDGGAIKNEWGTLEVTDSTFTANTATTGPGGAIDNATGNPTDLVLQNSILAGNTATTGPDISGSVATDNDYNVVGTTSGSSGLTGSHDTLNVATLVWNGGTSGTWSTGTTDWLNGASSVAWTNGDVAVFGTANAAVTISGGVTADAVVFNNSGITVSSSTLTLGAGDGIVSTTLGDSATISSVVAGSVGLTLTGSGTMTLNGSSYGFGGAATVSAGTLVLGTALNGDGFNPGGGITINSGATLQDTGDTIGNSVIATVNGTFDLENNEESLGAIQGSGSVINVGANSNGLCLDFTSTAAIYTFSGTISGPGGLQLRGENTHSNPSTLILSARTRTSAQRSWEAAITITPASTITCRSISNWSAPTSCRPAPPCNSRMARRG